MLIRILDKEKFVYISDTCRFYGIAIELIDPMVEQALTTALTEEPKKDDNLSTGSKQGTGKAQTKPSLNS